MYLPSPTELKRIYGDPMDEAYADMERWFANHSPIKSKIKEKYGYEPKRNSICPCGSKKKYKNCCYEADKQL